MRDPRRFRRRVATYSTPRLSDRVSFLGSCRVRVEELSRVALRIPRRVLNEERRAGAFLFIECISVATPPGGSHAGNSRRDELRGGNQISKLAVHIHVRFL